MRISSLMICILLVPTMIVNYLVDMPLYLNGILILVLMFYGIIFIVTHDRPISPRIQIAFITIGAISMFPLWFLNGGLMGSISPFLFLLLLMGSFTAGRKHQRLVIIMYFVMIGSLIILESLFPELLHPFVSEEAKQIDVITGFILASIASATLVTTFRINYLRDRKKLLMAKSQLQTTNLHLEIAQKESEKASKAKSAFLANMSHEIRTPLNSIIGAIDLLKNSTLTKEQEVLLNLMGESSENLLRLLTDVLDISKIEADKISIREEAIQLDAFVKQMQSFSEALIQKEGKDIEFRIVVDGLDSNSFESDNTRLTQVLTNLISNAVKYTNQGWIELSISMIKSASGKKAELHFSVRDSGIGIREDQIDFINKPFNQIVSNSNGAISGVGLGLAISRSILRLLNGRLEIESVFGQGSTFRAIVPYLSVENQREEKDRFIGNFTPISNTKIRILLVEDNRINQIIIKKMLDKLVLRCDIAADGYECLEMIETTNYDCILMDLNMPGINGIETCRRIRNNTNLAYSPRIIAITANVLEEDEEQGLEAGMNGFLPKPITLTAMAEKINSVMK